MLVVPVVVRCRWWLTCRLRIPLTSRFLAVFAAAEAMGCTTSRTASGPRSCVVEAWLPRSGPWSTGAWSCGIRVSSLVAVS
eukprot:12703496-Alexandrium_andersonii.AAC.1